MSRCVGALLLILSSAAALHAEVRVDRRIQLKSDDPLYSRVIAQFGLREETIIVKGDRMIRTVGPDRAELIDLREERLYTLDLRRKTYSYRSFAELRQEVEAARVTSERANAESERVREDLERQGIDLPERNDRRDEAMTEKDKERMQALIRTYEHTTRPTGQRQTINGFDAREVVSITKLAPTAENPGGALMTMTQWLADLPALDEVDAFERRYAELTGTPRPAAMPALQPDMTATAAAGPMSAMMQELMAKIHVDDSVTGTPVLTIYQTGPAVEPERQPDGGGAGGVLGALGRFGLGRSRERDRDVDRMPSMTMQQEIVRLSTTVSDDEVAIPAGFRLVEPRRR